MTSFKRSKTAIAHEALNLVPGLTSSARQVGGALIAHHNHNNGQCDPSVGRLARMLGLNPATVKRATADLDKAGLIGKAIHGGHSNRTQYWPNWDRFTEIVDDWQVKMKNGGHPGLKGAKLKPHRAQDCAFARRNPAPQTLSSNSLKEPGALQAKTSTPIQSVSEGGAVGLEGAEKRLDQKPVSPVAHTVRLGSRKLEAARQQAYRQWSSDLREYAGGWEREAAINEHITDTLMEAATDAEMHRRDDGLAYILQSIREIEAGNSTGPSERIHLRVIPAAAPVQSDPNSKPKVG